MSEAVGPHDWTKNNLPNEKFLDKIACVVLTKGANKKPTDKIIISNISSGRS